jgi:hypothetical protein
MGDFILTGSAQFDLMSGMTQSLAGRVGRIELAAVGRLPDTLEDMLLRGAYERQGCRVVRWRELHGLGLYLASSFFGL